MSEYCLYLRKSRADKEAEARGEGETFARHEKSLLELAHRLQLTVTEIYREIVSGETIAARPVMQKLLSEVTQGMWKGVLLMEVERLARGNTIDQGIIAQAFQCSNTQIVTPLKVYNPNDEFDAEYFEFGLFMSRREYKTINRRLQRGRLASINEGKYVSNKAPYGYKRIKLEDEKGWTLEPVPEEADIIRLIFLLYTTGEMQPDGIHKRLGASLIARRLNAIQAPTKNGGAWAPATIYDILRNPVYIGKIRWNWRRSVQKIADGTMIWKRPRASDEECIIVQGRHPPIVAEETFHAAQVQMKTASPPSVRESDTLKNPLAGLVICGKCGRRMVRRPHGVRHSDDTLLCVSANCNNVSCSLTCVEERLLAGLSLWVGDHRLEWKMLYEDNAPPSKDKQKTKRYLEKELTALMRQRGEVHTLLEQGVYGVETFRARTCLLEKRIAVVQNTLSAISSEISLESTQKSTHSNFLPEKVLLYNVYQQLSNAKEKNDLLKTVLEKAVYTKTHRARWHGFPDDFDLVLYPRLPGAYG
ncbi:MAG: recombinase family protein [Oscillospiraceae bacterium]|nr:recombinase family protein [Oscillospiraceae bacterium]